MKDASMLELALLPPCVVSNTAKSFVPGMPPGPVPPLQFPPTLQRLLTAPVQTALAGVRRSSSASSWRRKLDRRFDLPESLTTGRDIRCSHFRNVLIKNMKKPP